MSTYVPIESKVFPGWFEIPEYSGYCANRNGQILNKKTKNFTLGGRAGRYLKVSAYKDGNTSPSLYYVHDLVCRAFYGLPEIKMVVMHRDNNRSNNKPSNLRWGTQSENILQVYQDGLKYSKKYSVAKEEAPNWIRWDNEIGINPYDPSLEAYDYVSINSSNIATLGFDKKKKEMEVTFKSGSIYIFFEVAYQRFFRLATATSVGRYFQKNIKGHYSYKRIK